MVGFQYYDKSTTDIIDVPLLLVDHEVIGSLGTTRSKVEGERTMSRPVVNEFGTVYDPLSFSYALIKSDYDVYSEDEQVKIERWLTSPKISSELKVTDCHNNHYSYFGLFTETRWEIANGGYAICVFTFSVNGAYPYKYYAQEIWNSDTDELTNGYASLTCHSDELEEYVYPIITCEGVGGATSSFKIVHVSDDNKAFEVITDTNMPIAIDCQLCRVYTYSLDDYENRIEMNSLSFADLGWEDVGNIYWPRLKPGNNIFYIESESIITLSYYSTFKKIGGWLI